MYLLYNVYVKYWYLPQKFLKTTAKLSTKNLNWFHQKEMYYCLANIEYY